MYPLRLILRDTGLAAALVNGAQVFERGFPQAVSGCAGLTAVKSKTTIDDVRTFDATVLPPR